MGSDSEEFITDYRDGDLDGSAYFPMESENYPLCANESLANITLSSLFCNKSGRTLPQIPINTDYQENSDLERIVSVVVPILFGIIFIVGLFGNALVVIVVASNKQMRNTTNILIINLAMADLLFIIFCVPFTAADYVLNYWPFGVTWCKTVQYLIIVTAYVSVYTLVIMSVDRFLAVVYPVASISIRTEYHTYLAIIITWTIILLSCLPAFTAHGLTEYTYAYVQHKACTFNQEYNHAAFQIAFMLTSYAIPLTMICLLYFGMLFRLWKTAAASSSGRSIRGKKRVTRMIVVVVGVFAICWLPIQLVLLLKSLRLYEITDLTVAIQITSHVLGYMNSCVNPLIYSVLSENFRKAFRKVIQCKFLFGQGNGMGGHHGSQIIKPRPSNVHLHPPSCVVANEFTSVAGGANNLNPRGSGSRKGSENLILIETGNHCVAKFNKGSKGSLNSLRETALAGSLRENGTPGGGSGNHNMVTWNGATNTNSSSSDKLANV